MVNCELSHLDGNGKVQFSDYLFAVPSSGDLSQFDAYKVQYDQFLQIHRVFEGRQHAVDPKDVLWNECVTWQRKNQALALSHIAFPFLSWPVPAPVSRNHESSTEDQEDNSSTSSESSGTNTPITPVTPSPECSSPDVDLLNTKLPHTTAVDLSASLKEPQGYHTRKQIEKGLPGPSPLRICWSGSDTAGELQQTITIGRLPAKTPPQKLANLGDGNIRESNAECKTYQAKPHTPGYLSQYVRAGSEAEIAKFWLASPLSRIGQGCDGADNLAEALWRWHQMCLKTKELRMFGGFVAPRLSAKQSNIDGRSAGCHPTDQLIDGNRSQARREFVLDRIPFTEPYKKDGKGKGQVRIPHHFNLYNQPVYYKTYTPPEVSLWAAQQPRKFFRDDSRELLLLSEAYKLVDPYYYYGPDELLKERGIKLREIVTGLVAKVYTLSGTWVYDRYEYDETVPMSWEQVAKRCGWPDRQRQTPQAHHSQSNVKEPWRCLGALDLAPKTKPMPESDVESRRPLEALYLEWNRPMPELEDLRVYITTITAQAPATVQQADSLNSEEHEVASDVSDEQSGPERQTTASAGAGKGQDRSYSDLGEDFAEEDLIESTPPSQRRFSVSPDVGTSPIPVRRLPFDNGPAEDLTRALELETRASDEEVQALLARTLQRSSPKDRPHVHNSEDEDSIDYTHTWPKRNVLPTAPNPKLAQYKETSTEEEEDLDTSKFAQTTLGQARGQTAQRALPFGPQPSTSLSGVQPQTTCYTTPPNTSSASDLDFKESVEDMEIAGAEATAPSLETQGSEGASDGGSELSEPETVDGWLEYMAERGAGDDVMDNEPPAQAIREGM